MTTLTVAQALALILDGAAPLPAEPVALAQAHDRILATDVTAKLTQPPFDASAMDGFAARLSDLAHLPATLTLIGQSAAGNGYHAPLAPGQAVRILTGAPVPPGADTVVIQENTTRVSSTVTINARSLRPENIRPTGGDFRIGDTILAAGSKLSARALMLAAASGHGMLPVRRRPRVAILATGDELVPPGVTPGPDQIVSSNPVGLAALVRTFGGEPILLGHARDTVADIAACIQSAPDADILITTGGVSVGDHDHVAPALASLGMTLGFWKLAMRPGKPLLFGRLSHQRVLGLPGNPVSCLVTARVFLVPLIRALLGLPPSSDEIEAITTTPLAANGPRQHYMRAVLEARPSSTPSVSALDNQDSSLVRLLASANALIIRPPDAPALPAGSSLQVLPLDL